LFELEAPLREFLPQTVEYSDSLEPAQQFFPASSKLVSDVSEGIGSWVEKDGGEEAAEVAYC
jgi:hypothetical protein